MIDSRFIDDGRIIKKNDINLIIDDDSEEEEKIEDSPPPISISPTPQTQQHQQQPKKSSNKKKQKIVMEDERITALKELIHKTKLQRTAKWVDIRVHQRMYNRVNSNADRQKCEKIYTTASEELKFLDLRLEVMKELLQELTNG